MIQRGEIYLAKLSPVVGSEQGGIRPVVIVQNNKGNRFSPTVIVAAITSSKTKPNLPTHIRIMPEESGLKKPSIILLEQIRTLDKSRLIEKIGCLAQEKIQELVSRSQQDDKRAFALLVSEFQPLVFRLAFRLLCDEEEARDITQETFVKVWLSLKTYNQENRLSTWLYKITCNTCYDRLRSLRHSPLDNESAFSDSVNIPSDDHIEISLSNKQLKELILRYTNELPPQQKLVFTLRDVEELEVAEVQIITGLSPEKIKSTLYLARKNIRNKMNQIDPDL